MWFGNHKHWACRAPALEASQGPDTEDVARLPAPVLAAERTTATRSSDDSVVVAEGSRSSPKGLPPRLALPCERGGSRGTWINEFLKYINFPEKAEERTSQQIGNRKAGGYVATRKTPET